jgi:hypothetical protein
MNEAPEGARTFLSASRVVGNTGGQECPRSFMHTRCQLATPKEFAPDSGFSYRQYPSEHDGR